MVSSGTVGIQVQAVKRGFGQGPTRVEVLHGIDLEVRLGEMLLLVGPSGSGKTTLLCLIAGLLDAERGSISIFGKRLEELSVEAKTELRPGTIGFVFQQFNLLPTLTAQENVAIPLQVQNLPRRKALDRAAAMLGEVGLDHRLNSLPANLSGGEQQRVAIARALITEPRLLICDEPTAALDGDTGVKIMMVLRQAAVKPDRCVIVVTHDSRIFQFGDRIARMSDGRIVSCEPIVAGEPDGKRG
jgi:putative ABC transport system ATP-binding protein